jgi:hypothetical protein
MAARPARTSGETQNLHLVFGGELESLDGTSFRDLSALDILGIYPSYAEAYAAWKGAAQRTVDNAAMRYFIVPFHEMLLPRNEGTRASEEGASARR